MDAGAGDARLVCGCLVFGAVRRRGAEEAGAVFVKIALMDGTALLFVPAPQTAYDDSRPVERVFIQSPPQAVDEATVEASGFVIQEEGRRAQGTMRRFIAKRAS